MKDWLKLFEKISEYHWQQNVLPVWEKYDGGTLPWQSAAIFLSTYAFERSGVNPNYALAAEDSIQEGLEEIEENNHNLESALWKLFCKKMKYGEDEGYGGLNYGRNPLSPFRSKTETKPDGKSLFARMKKEKVNNLTGDLQALTIREAFSFLNSIRGIGPKITSFFLRDLSEKCHKKPPEDRELLQPIDVWIRRIVFTIRVDNWSAENEYDNRRDREIAEWIVEEAKKAKCNPERINMGMWYFGSQVCGRSKYRFDQIFRSLESAKKAWKDYRERIQRACGISQSQSSKSLQTDFGDEMIKAMHKAFQKRKERKEREERTPPIFTQLSQHT